MIPDAYLRVRYKYTTILDTVITSLDRVEIVESSFGGNRAVKPAGRIICVYSQVLRDSTVFHAKRNDTDRHPSRITVGNLRLNVVEYDAMRDAYLCAVDNPVGWITAFWYRTRQHLHVLKARLIATAAVWGLAKWRHGDVTIFLQWRDIYAIDWLHRKTRRAK